MLFYRGSNALAVEEELATIVDSIEKKQNKGRTITDLLKQLSGPSFRKPYSCIGILDMTYKFAGLNAVSYYAEEFMDDVGAGIWKPAEAAVVLASFKFLTALLSPLILLKLQKKTVFVTLSFISALSFLAGNINNYTLLFGMC